MVHLYGVTHGGHWNEFLTGYAGEMRISPTMELIADLSRFPKGTRIGFECMSKQDWDEVKLNLYTLPFDRPKPRFEDQEFASRPYYTRDNPNYWDNLGRVCSDLEFDVVFLEDKNIWFKYNEAIIKAAENKARRENLFVREQGESNEHYDRKIIGFNVERHREDIFARKIHEIDRDNQLLRAIQSSGVDVAFVGIGHFNYWLANPQIIQSNFGLKFESYSAEVPRMKEIKEANPWESNPWERLIVFNKDAQPNPRIAFIRISLERAIKLLETGRISDRDPDFIGTWDIHNPLSGYFEMFVDSNGEKINGEIIDCLGDANFEGTTNHRKIKFVKKYREERCSEGAILKEIVYNGIVREGNIIGYFVMGGFGEPFYATPEQAKDFVDLGTSWGSSLKRYRKGMKSLRNRLFDKKPTILSKEKERCEEDTPF